MSGDRAGEPVRRDLAHQLLAQRKGDARGRGELPTGSGRIGEAAGSYSGAHPDLRDPRPLGDSLAELMDQRGWSGTAQAVRVSACWDRLVGPEIAKHCHPERLADGELTLVAVSTAWATQLRLLSTQLVRRLAAELGPDLVLRVRVRGPTMPSWRHGRLRVSGRGPRDTYG